MNQFLVFAFGTLKQGFPNHSHNCGVRLSGNFVTRKKYPLHLVGERHSPWMIDRTGEGKHVVGQVFAVDKAGLQKMDRLERTHEPDGYKRITILVIDKNFEQELEVFAYLKSSELLDNESIRAKNLTEYAPKHVLMYRRR